ncbi:MULTISPECIES: hypothetical protein [Brucella]|uniref:Lipoprotein n=1 Tax=Brucella pseudogrignonensis TaxID=419475 RepID=A0A7Y3WZV2_9HYPH|nr:MULTISPECIES: hypothetical protein [Brucella]EMG54651.1 lipoprotein [Ochrobactrum sp. CDB2]MBK0020785.1 hypothetical protein [Ochrobactrum sp. S45]MBK0042476.1 hypothetical protein [Ochrobactrum sp. S46]MBO1024040.1 hypothetical protein [Ochrobactrum sp. SD129]MQP38506.1 hypothetical protein [Ochrobactrum sp. MYb237]QWK78420.1 hypothetical protein KMS41_04040 [Ochrobactrum sp. BTU1]
MKNKTIALVALPALALFAACTPKPTPPTPTSVSKAALATMERIAVGANSCWFKSNDKDFRGYAFAPELNSFSGRPRMLVVPARNLAGRPLLVVQAEGNPARIEAFGPMMQQGHSSRISADINRWASGQKGC